MARRAFPAAFVLLALASAAYGAAPKLSQTPAIVVLADQDGRFVVLDASTLAPLGTATAGRSATISTPGRWLVIFSGPGGAVTVPVSLAGQPVPPAPPTPKPPVPPKPDPPEPTPTGKLWVLIIDNPLLHAGLPQEQINALTSKKVRDALKDRCATDESGSPAFRIAAPGEDFAKDTKLWQEAAKKLKGKELKVPYWMIGSEDTGEAVIEPFPENADAAVARLVGG